MLSRKFKNILLTKPANGDVVCRPLVQTRSFSKLFDILSGKNMASTIRLKVIRELFVSGVLNAWTRSYVVNTVFKRCMNDKGMNKMFFYFRQVFFRPRTQLLVSATATFKNTEEKPGPPKKCTRNIKDKEMKRLIKDLDRVEDLSKATLFCEGCDKRIVIDTKHKGVQYCDCPNSQAPVGNYDGWVPYMEAEDVIIWRKEYKPGGLYAYKVYGRYPHIKAEDFAMIQVDGAYRKVWDTAVAGISVVEQGANGVSDQTVLQWEVLWPTLFANRDYVYLRRHKTFNVHSRCLVHKDGIFPDKERCKPDKNYTPQCNVHARAKEKSLEMERKEAQGNQPPSDLKQNKVYVIVSRSCTHPQAPETKNAVRVMEYWSHMVITTLNGPDRPGMEFVLTYYDEPAVGGLPTAVTSWAMGRAGPAFLLRMREAAQEYHSWRQTHQHGAPDFSFEPANVAFDRDNFDDDDLEDDPDLDNDPDSGTSDGSTQTRPVVVTPIDNEPRDGPKLEVEAVSLKYATVESPIPELASGPPAGAPDDVDGEDLDSVKYQLSLSTPLQHESETLPTAIETDEKHINITIQVPISAISKLAEMNTDYKEKGKEVKTKDYIEKNKVIAQSPAKKYSVDVIKTNVELEGDGDKDESVEEKDGDSIAVQEKKYSFWRYLSPYYYFV